MQQKFSITNSSTLTDTTAHDIANAIVLPDGYHLSLENGSFDDITSAVIFDDCGTFVGCISLHNNHDIEEDGTLSLSGFSVCLCFRQVIDKHELLDRLARKYGVRYDG